MIWISDHDGQKSHELSYFPIFSLWPYYLTRKSWYQWYPVSTNCSTKKRGMSPSVGHGTVPPKKKWGVRPRKKLRKPRCSEVSLEAVSFLFYQENGNVIRISRKLDSI